MLLSRKLSRHKLNHLGQSKTTANIFIVNPYDEKNFTLNILIWEDRFTMFTEYKLARDNDANT